MKARTMVQQKKVLGFLTYSVVLYLILALVFYFKVFPAAVTRQEQFMVILPFLAFPGLIWGIKKFFTWWYHKKVMRADRKLELLKEKKTKLLEEVVEKETYKVAMQILEKFGKSQPVPSLAAANIGDVFRESAVGAGGLVRGALGEGGNLIRLEMYESSCMYKFINFEASRQGQTGLPQQLLASHHQEDYEAFQAEHHPEYHLLTHWQSREYACYCWCFRSSAAPTTCSWGST